ncbi:MAG TPA: DUF1223 domain-containing protein [Alphaproteobacteria bacterium]|jgi:hypothetical protein|nr:DUF1223 domain-containing protein [Alphaproteobacteria bacterium]
MKRHLTAAVLAASAMFGTQTAIAEDSGPVVVELFTSQGCSSCPPADAFLGELAHREDVIALAFHVDYWDYIGWKDPFASPDHTLRQRSYARALGLRTVYTPQMVIDGRADAVGSNRSRVDRLIDGARELPKLAIGLESSAGKHMLSLPDARIDRPATIWLAIYEREERTSVRRGENAGRDLSNYNIVREFRRLADWDGTARTLGLDLSEAMKEGMGCAILVQAAGQGPILAALAVP